MTLRNSLHDRHISIRRGILANLPFFSSPSRDSLVSGKSSGTHLEMWRAVTRSHASLELAYLKWDRGRQRISRGIPTWRRLRCRRWSAPRTRWTPNWTSSKSTCWRHENSVSVPVLSPARAAISGDLKRENYIRRLSVCSRASVNLSNQFSSICRCPIRRERIKSASSNIR